MRNGIFANRLENLLKIRGMTQIELADMCGITDVTMNRILHGYRMPNAVQAKNIVQTLNTSADYLLGITNDPESLTRQAKRVIHVDATLDEIVEAVAAKLREQE